MQMRAEVNAERILPAKRDKSISNREKKRGSYEEYGIAA